MPGMYDFEAATKGIGPLFAEDHTVNGDHHVDVPYCLLHEWECFTVMKLSQARALEAYMYSESTKSGYNLQVCTLNCNNEKHCCVGGKLDY